MMVMTCGNIPADILEFIDKTHKIDTVMCCGLCSRPYSWATEKHKKLEMIPLDHHKHGDKAVFVQAFKLLQRRPDLILAYDSTQLLSVYVDKIASEQGLAVMVVGTGDAK